MLKDPEAPTKLAISVVSVQPRTSTVIGRVVTNPTATSPKAMLGGKETTSGVAVSAAMSAQISSTVCA